MAIVPGTCEEIFFRGAVQSALASRWRGAAAVSLTAAVFGAIHLDPPQAIGAAILGLYLGFLAHETGSIGPSIAAHVLNNSLAWVAANFLTDLDFGYGSANPTPWSIVGGGAVLCLACAAGVRFGRRKKPE